MLNNQRVYIYSTFEIFHGKDPRIATFPDRICHVSRQESPEKFWDLQPGKPGTQKTCRGTSELRRARTRNT
jgi:hypothetical protein